MPGGGGGGCVFLLSIFLAVRNKEECGWVIHLASAWKKKKKRMCKVVVSENDHM